MYIRNICTRLTGLVIYTITGIYDTGQYNIYDVSIFSSN